MDSRPAGFTLAATVEAPEDDETDPQSRALMPARYVIETDALLRIATGPSLLRPGAAYPLQSRRLSPWQMDEIWALAVEAQLLDPAHPGLRPSAPGPVQHATAPAATFEVTTEFAPSIIVVVLDDESPQAQRARALLDRLAEFAWISE